MADNITHIQQAEGTGFEFDEKAIEVEYQKINANKSSLSIRVLSILGGILATLAFMPFIFLGGLLDSAMGLTVLGVLFLSGAVFVNIKSDRLIIDTFSVATYLIGCGLLMFGLMGWEVDESMICLLFVLIAALTLRVTQNFMLSFISVLTLNGGIVSLIILNEVFNLLNLHITVLVLGLSAWVLLEARIITSSKLISRLYDPVRIGLIFSLLGAFVFTGMRELVSLSHNYVWLSSIATIPCVLYLVMRILSIIGITDQNHKIFLYAACFLVLLPTALSPAISGALLIILLSFLVNYKTGFVIGIISVTYFLSRYYYDLNFTLLVKSIILFSSGVMFILFYLFTNKKLAGDE